MRKSSVNTSFFIELIIAILFFSLCIAITLQFFVAAHLKSELSKEINIAMVQLQNEAEEIKSMVSVSDIQKRYQAYEEKADVQKNNIYIIPFQQDWSVATDHPKYIIEIQLENEIKPTGNFIKASLVAYKINNDKKDVLGHLETSRYINQ